MYKLHLFLFISFFNNLQKFIKIQIKCSIKIDIPNLKFLKQTTYAVTSKPFYIFF